MNQAIQIVDGFEYIDEHSAVRVMAICGGLMISCYISDLDKTQAGSFYHTHQFDLEDKLVEMIEQERWNESGEVWLSASSIIC